MKFGGSVLHVITHSLAGVGFLIWCQFQNDGQVARRYNDVSLCMCVCVCSIFQWHHRWCCLQSRGESGRTETLVHYDARLPGSVPASRHRSVLIHYTKFQCL